MNLALSKCLGRVLDPQHPVRGLTTWAGDGRETRLSPALSGLLGVERGADGRDVALAAAHLLEEV